MSQAESVTRHWLSHRSVLLELMDRIDDAQADFRPWDKALSVSELAVHIATSAQMFVDAVSTGTLVAPTTKLAASSLPEARQIFRDKTEHTRESLLALRDEQFAAIVDAKQTLGFEAPGKVFLRAFIDHEIHHKGQMFVYARLTGVDEVPFFIARN